MDGAREEAVDRSFMLLGDQPFVEPGDPLGFDKAAEDLAALILDSSHSTPFTLGVEASWGMGKSSLMGALQERLQAVPWVTSTQFNAWTAEEGRVLEAFVKTVLERIGPGLLSRALYRQKAIGMLRLPATIIASKLGISSVVDTAWQKLAKDPTGRNELHQLLDKAVGSWRRRRAQGKQDRLLCVFVDDLDRCSPAVVLEVLEAMKLYLDVPGMVFVVGYDEDIVSEVVQRDRGYGDDRARARSYLEKFIQISYRIPRPDGDQSDALVESLLKASGVGALLGESERQLVLERSAWNPRRIKRFINSFVLVNGLDRQLREFHPQSLVRVLLLQMYFPQFTRLLERPSERDPLEEFLEYEAARTCLSKRVLQGPAKDVVAQALKNHSLGFEGDLASQNQDELLRRLEQEIPVEFPPLALDEEFVELVRSIASQSTGQR